jgi:uncharacterized protein
MVANALVDAGFLVALLSRRDANHRWAVEETSRFPPPWMTCEAALSETFHLLGGRGTAGVASLLYRGALICSYRFADDMDAVLKLLEKYSQVPMSFADACLVRMTEVVQMFETMIARRERDRRKQRQEDERIRRRREDKQRSGQE